jgi:hypothetical protein
MAAVRWARGRGCSGRRGSGVVVAHGSMARSGPVRAAASRRGGGAWATAPACCVTSQHVGQLRDRIEGFCAYHPKLWNFFTLLSLKPKGDRVSFRGGNDILSKCERIRHDLL